MAIVSSTEWDVRTTGSDSNGGGFDATLGGTDYSQQDTAQVAYTDLVIGATNTQLTSAANPFTSAHKGNVINIPSGVTGFTAGRYQVTSVSGSVATMDRAVGTASSTGGTGNLGGAMATVGAAASASFNGNTVWVKSGTYTGANSITAATSSQGTMRIAGYGASHGDNGTKPLLTISTDSTSLVTISGGNFVTVVFENISFSSTATVKSNGINIASFAHPRVAVRDCSFTGFTWAINGTAATFYAAGIYLVSSEITNCSSGGVISGGHLYAVDSYIHGVTGPGLRVDGNNGNCVAIIRCILAGNTNGFGVINSFEAFALVSSTLSGNTSSAVNLGTNGLASPPIIENNIFDGNGAYGIEAGTGVVTFAVQRDNAFRANTSGNRHNVASDNSDIALTASPFTASGSGDYSPNSTAGAGAACKGAGYPGVFPGGTTTGSLDIGAVQSASGGGGGGGTPVNFGWIG